ncbi:MAG TPA: hypothetical protein VFQ25_11070 [Ktedonobacterales bacterium]|nr:hypothetical protein [Ktedonobacterales bacterium]
MRIRWRGSRLIASLMGLACVATLSACLGGTSAKLPAGTAATKGPVTVTTNLSAFTANDAIGVTVSNNGSSDYYAVSGKSACVIVQLERYSTTKKAWELVDACPTRGTAQVYAITKNSQQPFTLAPTSSADVNAWDAGLYRVTVTYSAKSDGVTNALQAQSAAFYVR